MQDGGSVIGWPRMNQEALFKVVQNKRGASVSHARMGSSWRAPDLTATFLRAEPVSSTQNLKKCLVPLGITFTLVQLTDACYWCECVWDVAVQSYPNTTREPLPSGT